MFGSITMVFGYIELVNGIIIHFDELISNMDWYGGFHGHGVTLIWFVSKGKSH